MPGQQSPVRDQNCCPLHPYKKGHRRKPQTQCARRPQKKAPECPVTPRVANVPPRNLSQKLSLAGNTPKGAPKEPQLGTTPWKYCTLNDAHRYKEAQGIPEISYQDLPKSLYRSDGKGSSLGVELQVIPRDVKAFRSLLPKFQIQQ